MTNKKIVLWVFSTILITSLFYFPLSNTNATEGNIIEATPLIASAKQVYIEPEEIAIEPFITLEEAIEIDEHDIELLACTIYQEAGSDSISDECRYMVGDVVMNRVHDDRFPNDIEGVLTQKGQYGRFHWTGVVWPSKAQYDCELHAVERAYEIAENILTDEHHSDLYGNGYVWQAGFYQGTNIVESHGIYFGK